MHALIHNYFIGLFTDIKVRNTIYFYFIFLSKLKVFVIEYSLMLE